MPRALYLILFFMLPASLWGADLFEPSPEKTTLVRNGETKQIDTNRGRPIITLEEEKLADLKIPLDLQSEGYLWIANYRHKKQHWIARVPVDNIHRTLFQVIDRTARIRNPSQNPIKRAAQEIEAMPHFHGQLRFQFNEPILLFSQDSEISGPRTPLEQTQDLLHSAEASRIQGEVFSVPRALKGDYKLSLVMTSMEEKQDEISHPKFRRPATQVLMTLGSEEAKRYLLTESRTSERNTYNKNYHPIKASCTTEIFCALDTLNGNSPANGFLFWPHSSEYILQELRQRNLIDESAPIPSYNEEIGVDAKITSKSLFARGVSGTLDCIYFLQRIIKKK